MLQSYSMPANVDKRNTVDGSDIITPRLDWFTEKDCSWLKEVTVLLRTVHMKLSKI
jgi:hypothetical protein